MRVVPGRGHRWLFTASPWSYHGKVFLLSEQGATCVIAEGPSFRLLATNRLDEACLASPAIARGSLFIRTFSKLYRLEAAT